MYSRRESSITFTQDTTAVLSESSIQQDSLTVIPKKRVVPLHSCKPSTPYAENNAATSSNILSKSLENHPLLSSTKERELLERVAKGDLEARETLAMHNVRLVLSIARKYLDNGINFEDLFMEGFSGLLKGIDKYDISRPDAPRLSTYACQWIRQSIRRAIETQSRSIRMPAYSTELHANIKKTASELYTSTGVTPSPKEIAEKLGISDTRVSEILNLEYNSRTFSLDTTASEQDSSDAMINFIPNSENVEDMVVDKVFTEDLFSIIDQSDLTDREKRVFLARSGCLTGETLTLESLGEELNFSKEYIRQIELRAKNKLRRSQRLHDYLELDDTTSSTEPIFKSWQDITSITPDTWKLNKNQLYLMFLLAVYGDRSKVASKLSISTDALKKRVGKIWFENSPSNFDERGQHRITPILRGLINQGDLSLTEIKSEIESEFGPQSSEPITPVEYIFLRLHSEGFHLLEIGELIDLTSDATNKIFGVLKSHLKIFKRQNLMIKALVVGYDEVLEDLKYSSIAPILSEGRLIYPGMYSRCQNLGNIIPDDAAVTD